MKGDLINAVLGNHLILKTIFGQISGVEDLKLVRLVSTSWRNESLAHWRRTATLYLNWGALEPPTNCLTQDQLLDLWLRSTELGDACPYQLAKTPFTRYRIDNCSLLHVGSVECNKLERFLNIFSPGMKNLHLDQSMILPEHYGPVMKWIMCKKAGSLEELEVYLPQKFRPVISTEQLLWAELDASSKAPVSMVRKVTVEVCGVEAIPETIPNKNTSISGTFFTGNSFPHLAHLHLKGERVISFKGLKSLTCLQTLRIESNPCSPDWNLRIARDAEEHNMYWGKLAHIHVDYFRFIPKTLEILGRWMPNLKRVELKFNARTRGMVPQLWPDIEEVTDLTTRNANGLCV